MGFLKTIAGKIVSGLVGLAVIATGISWWHMDAATRQWLLNGTGHIVAWFGVVMLLPWVTFFIINRVRILNSNTAAGLLVVVYTAAESLLLLWLNGWSLPGATAWTFFAVGTLFAGVYNLFTCDWIADRME